jgi:hypothetical protein
MPTLTVTKSYSNGTVLSESHLDDIKSSVETFVNTTKLGSDNLQAGAVGTTQLDSAAVTTAKIANNSVTDSKLSSSGSTDADRAVNTNHIKDVAVTTAKIADLAVTTAKINDLGVTTGKINDAAVTRAKLASVGQQTSSSSGSFSTTSTSFTDVTNLSVSITTTGRPVIVAVVANPGSSNCNIQKSTAGTAGANFKILRDASTITDFRLLGADQCSIPPSSLSTIDAPAAGTYTYKVQAKADSSATASVVNCVLIAYEL